MKTATQERRQFPRSTAAPQFEINLLDPRLVLASNVNFSEGGLCFRLREALEIRSLIRFRLTSPPQPSRSAGRSRIECLGRVAWVVQRLDLRDAPPFLYDIGIEFVDPPSPLRRMLPRGATEPAAVSDPKPSRSSPPPVMIRDRRYVPQLVRTPGHQQPWHLVVLVDENPCFSGRYATEREALAAWTKQRRQLAR